MGKNTIFNITRFSRLVWTELQINARSCLLYGAGIVFLWFVFANSAWYFWVLIGGGVILTSYNFTVIKKPETAIRYLTLPCSNLEKWLSKWLLSGIVYAISISVLYQACWFVSDMLFQRIMPISLEHMLNAVIIYLGLHALVICGAIYFKRFVLLKTGITCIVLLLCVKSILLHWFASLMQHMGQIDFIMHQPEKTLWIALGSIWFSFMCVCWLLSFLRFRTFELQA